MYLSCHCTCHATVLVLPLYPSCHVPMPLYQSCHCTRHATLPIMPLYPSCYATVPVIPLYPSYLNVNRHSQWQEMRNVTILVSINIIGTYLSQLFSIFPSFFLDLMRTQYTIIGRTLESCHIILYSRGRQRAPYIISWSGRSQNVHGKSYAVSMYPCWVMFKSAIKITCAI